jgi:hypothetical protein
MINFFGGTSQKDIAHLRNIIARGRGGGIRTANPME